MNKCQKSLVTEFCHYFYNRNSTKNEGSSYLNKPFRSEKGDSIFRNPLNG